MKTLFVSSVITLLAVTSAYAEVHDKKPSDLTQHKPLCSFEEKCATHK